MGVGGALEAHPAANGARTAMAPDGFAFDFSGDGGARTLWAGPGLASTDDLDARARWAAFDLAHGLPRLAESQIEKWTPQQLSLERRSEEHTSELQSLMRISYAVFCLKKKNKHIST